MVKALAHVCFTVRDLNRSIRFYVEGLGLRPAFDFVRDTGERFGVYLQAGGRSFIELFQGEPAPPSDQGSYRHICLEVEDVAAAVASLRGKGIEVTDAAMGGDHSWQAWLADPDGNRIELHGYTPESMQAPFVG